MSGKRKKTRVNVSLDPELYRRAKALGLNVSGVSERALREYVDRLENGSGQSGVLVGTNGPDGSNDTSDDTADDTDANDDTDAKYADTPTEEVLGEYRQFATSVLDRSENTVQLHTRYIKRLLEHADTLKYRHTRSSAGGFRSRVRMTDYDDLFAETAPEHRIFADKSALDPLQDPDAVVAREDQQRRLATLLNGIESGYLPATVSIYGPPGTGKTLTTRRVATEFASRRDALAVEYVNLKECRTLFSAANEILLELTGERVQAYEGLDGAFEAIWTALEDYPAWTVLILDEIDHITQDSNYDPNDFFYRLLRGEGKLKRDIQLSVWLLSNELLAVDLRLDSRVQSAMSDEEVFFPPYGPEKLGEVVEPRLQRAFQDGALPAAVTNYGVVKAAHRWGDARKTLTLFRRAGETAVDRELEQVTNACIDENLETTDQEAVREKLLSLPVQHFFVLNAATNWTDRWTGEIAQPVTTEQIAESYRKAAPEGDRLGERAIRNVIDDLELMGLVETWIDSRGRDGRVKQVETTFEPTLVDAVREEYITQSSTLQARD